MEFVPCTFTIYEDINLKFTIISHPYFMIYCAKKGSWTSFWLPSSENRFVINWQTLLTKKVISDFVIAKYLKFPTAILLINLGVKQLVT